MMTIKQRIQNVIFPLGTIQKIRKGYLRGYKFRLTENSLWGPIIGNWEPTMQKIMVNVVKPGTIAYDIGANNGLHGLLLAGLVGIKGLVYNFEPLPSNIEEINENFDLNGIRNFINVEAAISNINGELTFEIGAHAKQGKINYGSNSEVKQVKVKVVSLDSFIDLGNKEPDFIKMDIEGAEGNALKGFSKHIEQCLPDMVIELHSPEQDLEVGQFLKFYKYNAYRFDSFKTLSFTQIKDFTKPFPEKDGIWGSIFCISSSKSFEQYSFNK